jgi:hypothetical protein
VAPLSLRTDGDLGLGKAARPERRIVYAPLASTLQALPGAGEVLTEMASAPVHRMLLFAPLPALGTPMLGHENCRYMPTVEECQSAATSSITDPLSSRLCY